MKYEVGDKVLIKDINWYNKNKNEDGDISCGEFVFVSSMSKFCGRILTIDVDFEDGTYLMKEDTDGFVFTNEMFDTFAEEEVERLTGNLSNSLVNEFELPEGYIFKDENGNVINATKIVLEKKKKNVNLTQEQINTIIHDSCVLFCKHCGCGIPRETCISLGTCKEHDEYRAAMRTRLMKKKKKSYPKTYEECCEVLDIIDNRSVWHGYRSVQLKIFQKLLICRDAYWKIAGEEMGLGKPWEPNWGKGACYTICCNTNQIVIGTDKFRNSILAFPTEEMRDAFYENFKELIEQCKELL